MVLQDTRAPQSGLWLRLVEHNPQELPQELPHLFELDRPLTGQFIGIYKSRANEYVLVRKKPLNVVIRTLTAELYDIANNGSPIVRLTAMSLAGDTLYRIVSSPEQSPLSIAISLKNYDPLALNSAVHLQFMWQGATRFLHVERDSNWFALMPQEMYNEVFSYKCLERSRSDDRSKIRRLR